MAEETSSPKVVPALTKTDARELKVLVRRDNEILLEELKYRYNDFMDQIANERERRAEEVHTERERREAEDREEADKAMAAIQRRIRSLNEAIIETLDGMVEAGWRGRFGKVINPHDFTISTNGPFSGLLPPGRDDTDLDEQYQAGKQELREVSETISANYREAKRNLEAQEAKMLRDLTLQSITTEAAREFILEMPSVEELLPAPAKLEALETGDSE